MLPDACRDKNTEYDLAGVVRRGAVHYSAPFGTYGMVKVHKAYLADFLQFSQK